MPRIIRPGSVDRGLAGVQVREVGTEGLGHPDGLAVVLLDGRAGPAEERGRVPGDHGLVEGEAPAARTTARRARTATSSP